MDDNFDDIFGNNDSIGSTADISGDGVGVDDGLKTGLVGSEGVVEDVDGRRANDERAREAMDHVSEPDVERRAGRGGRHHLRGEDVSVPLRVGHLRQAPGEGLAPPPHAHSHSFVLART